MKAAGRSRATPSKLVTVALVFVASATPARISAQMPTGRDAVDALEYPELDFHPPTVERREVGDVPVLLLESGELPLVTVQAYFRGGYGLFGRENYASAMGLPSMMRSGGTTSLSPDSIEKLLEGYAIQTSFGSAGGSVTSTVNVLTDGLDFALELWGDMLTGPRFDQNEIDVWRGRELESIRRREDDPGRLAFSEFNRLLFGDHPIGWEMDEVDLTDDRVSAERFHYVHGRVVCRDNLVLGVTGDIAWAQAKEKLEALVARIAPCAEELPESPEPEIRTGGGVYLIDKDLEQAVIVMAHPTDVRLGDTPEYYAAMIGNSILGGGGFSSRILGRVRTEQGFAYSATSLWTTPREHQGIIGAITRTRPETAVPAVRLILETMAELTAEPPTDDEVRTTVDQVVNGFVFNFDSPSAIVSRAVFYLAQDLPGDWLERYVRGVQEVTPATIRETFATHLRPDDMTILVVGDPDRIGRAALESLGPLRPLEPGVPRN